MVTFAASNFAGATGIYQKSGNAPLTRVVDQTTPIPGGTGNFTVFSRPIWDGSAVAFVGLAGNQGGYYLANGSTVQRIVDTNTVLPGGGRPTSFNGEFGFDAGKIGFSVRTDNFNAGVFTNVTGAITLVADRSTPIPGGAGNFEEFGAVSLDGNNIAFYGVGMGNAGIFTTLSGPLTRVIGTGDLLDGKTVITVEMGRTALAGDSISFSAIFSDGSSGIFVATIPEPGIGSLGLVLLTLLRRRAKRGDSRKRG